MTLRFVALELREVRIPFRLTFRHAAASRREAHALLLALRTDAGRVGYGEIVPRAYLTGETVESAWEDVEHRWWPGLRELELPADRPPLDALRSLYLEADRLRRTAAYAGVDVAAVDAWARSVGRSGRTLLGPPAHPVPLSAPLGGGGLGAAVGTAVLFRALGFRQFKLKVGQADDLRRVATVRAVLGPGLDLRVDANAAWTVEDAIERARQLKRYGISSIEQPVPPADPAAMARVQSRGGLPVVADESLCCLADARALLDERAAALWNVRLGKVGGFSGAREMTRLAQEHGIRVHLGVLVGETSVLAAAGRACLALGAFAHVEHGFAAALLRADPFRGGPRGWRGSGDPLDDRPGMGVEPIRARLDGVTVRRHTFGSHA